MFDPSTIAGILAATDLIEPTNSIELSKSVANVAYIAAAVLFIFSLGLSLIHI